MKTHAFRKYWRVLLVAVAVIATAGSLFVGSDGKANAHPLGNFTVNRYSALEVHTDRVSILYVVDMAEVPAFQETRAIDTDRDGLVSEVEKAKYIADKSEVLRRGLALSVGGRDRQLITGSSSVSFPAGQSGLSTLRLDLVFEASAPGGTEQRDLTYSDTNYAGKIGWQEIVARPADGVDFQTSSVPFEDVTDALRAYPEDRLQSPLDQRTAEIRYDVRTGQIASEASVTAGTATAENEQRVGGLSRILAADRLGPGLVALALVLAAGIGAFHALTPGHGKTIMAAYLAGTNGTISHVVMLAVTVAVSHTAGVLALGAATVFATGFFSPEAAYPVLSIAAGLIILCVGARLLATKLGLARLPVIQRLHPSAIAAGPSGGHPHSHAHGGGHSHAAAHDRLSDADPAAHSHSEEHAAGHHDDLHDEHEHARQGTRGTLRSLLLIGFADGLVPSASALLVWLAAISVGRAVFGVVLVAAFGIGMALVLTGVGLLLVGGRSYFAKRLGTSSSGLSQLGRAVPWVAAVFVMGAGALMLIRAVRELGAIS